MGTEEMARAVVVVAVTLMVVEMKDRGREGIEEKHRRKEECVYTDTSWLKLGTLYGYGYRV